MKICLINGNPDKENLDFEEAFQRLIEYFKKNHEADVFHLRDSRLKPCTGCFGCWVKTPGECLFEDDTMLIRKSGIHADIILFTSPIIMGFPSALIKHVQDKLIPLLHPYIQFIDKECHHQKRYETYPYVGLLYQKMIDTTEDDIRIMHDIYKRFVINFMSDLVLFDEIHKNPEEIEHALNLT